MEINEAVMAFSQSEKIKAGLIWASQSLELSQGLTPEEGRGSEATIHALLGMILQEVTLAMVLVRHDEWDGVLPPIEKAQVMIRSGVGHEAFMHLSKALSKVTNIGQQSMALLKEKALLP